MNYIFVAWSFFLLVTPDGVAAQNGYACGEPVDVAILLDTSSYFGLGNFAQLKLFAKHLLNYFELTANRLNTFVGFIPYSGKIVDKFVINFRYSYSIERLSVKIDQLHFYDTWETRLDLALKYSREKLFTVYNGSRPWVRHVVLAITGSVQHWDLAQKDAVQREAVLLRESDVKLMIASIDPTQSNQGYLRSLVDSQEHLYMLSYPYLLYGISENIARQACPVPSTLGCPGKVDIAFIVDSSGSISYPDYNKMKYFMFSIAKALNISETGARAGIVIYSKIAEMVVKFSDHTNTKSFRNVVYGLKHMKSFTRIDLGLQVAHTQLFSPIHGGARPGVKKLAFILTDGRQTSSEGIKISLKEAAQPLLDSGVKTLSIGIGASVDKRELRAMVEDDQDVITAENFDQLIKNIKNITQQTCEQITFTPCNHAADIVFLVDSSNQVSLSDFQKIKAFIIAVEKRFKISEFGSRHGVIVYGDRAEVLVNMNKARDSTEFVNAVNSLWRIGGGRASYRALELAENVLYDFNRTRRNVPKVVVIVTAGGESRFSNSAYLYQTAKRLRERAVVIKVVGIGSVSSRDELLPLVTSSADLFRSGSFDDLKDETSSLSESMCESIGPVMCDKAMDIAFILDSSGSIMKDEFSEARNFVKAIMETLTVSRESSHVGVMIYSNEARIMARFNEIQSNKELEDELDNLPHLRGKTRIDLALRLANAQLFTGSGGMRRSTSVAKVAMVITDGRQSPAADAIRLDEAVAPLLVKGVKVLAIGVGDKIDREELEMMVGSQELAFWAASYRALRVQLAKIAAQVCHD